jgi:uncharacterized protein YqjF (DUF2071 family)
MSQAATRRRVDDADRTLSEPAIVEMRWEDLLFAHWEVDPGIVARTLPDGLRLDTFDDRAYLGVFPFVMPKISPRFSPVGLSFPELNLRTYVVGADGTPGIYFYNLDATSRLGVRLGRSAFRLPYYRAEMSVDRERVDGRAAGPGRSRGADRTGRTVLENAGDGTERDGDRAVQFRSRRVYSGAPPARFDASYVPAGEPFETEPETLPYFLSERYRFYTEWGPDATGEGDVYYADIAHDQWTLVPATADIRENTLFRAAGFDHPDGDPLCHYARARDVRGGRLHRQRLVEESSNGTT